MINSLSIRNYALIQELDFSPSAKLSIITGETGAGKSIMLGAVGLLLGNRADTKVLWDEQKKCNVEGQFDLEDYNLSALFDELDLDYDHQCIIRREITPSGKSRAFINDTPVTLDILRKVGYRLMDIHSQHESLQLGSNLYQLRILDAFARHDDLINTYIKKFHAFKESLRHRDDLLARANASSQEEDYQRFILKELTEANLDDTNQEDIESELNILENAEEIKLHLTNLDQIIDQSEVSINNQFHELTSILRKLSRLSPEFDALLDRIESTTLELKDIHNELNRKNDGIIHDPDQIEQLRAQLDEIYRLQKKHKVETVSDLINIRDKISEDLLIADNLDEQIKFAEEELSKAENEMMMAGTKLTNSRQAAAEDFGKSIETVVHEIGIENGHVDIQILRTDPTEHGLDHVEVMFSANKGIVPKELKYVASGGEFSRLIFAIKYLIADKTALPTVIFDEIDTGVSGEIAIKMVRMMRKMANNHQVISISHLPQFAAGGDRHFFVFKDNEATKSVTKIRQLSEEERVEEIAKMIGGTNPTSMAFESARELLALPA